MEGQFDEYPKISFYRISKEARSRLQDHIVSLKKEIKSLTETIGVGRFLMRIGWNKQGDRKITQFQNAREVSL